MHLERIPEHMRLMPHATRDAFMQCTVIILLSKINKRKNENSSNTLADLMKHVLEIGMGTFFDDEGRAFTWC